MIAAFEIAKRSPREGSHERLGVHGTLHEIQKQNPVTDTGKHAVYIEMKIGEMGRKVLIPTVSTTIEP